jgi:Mrp family chromosome partitioning ATPase
VVKGRSKKVFPGGNTCKGFHSYYDYIIKPDATRILVIKGGPGVGKSTFMRAIGEEMQSRGFDVEFHCCSSDNGSLDGVKIPAIGVALIDGTAPHIVDPKHPGAVDEIIHLGDYWDEAKMRAAKDDILRAAAKVGRFFRTAYSHLAEAKVARDEMRDYVDEATNKTQLNRLTQELIRDVLDSVPPQYRYFPKTRRLFASAISPQGVVHYMETLLAGLRSIYILKGMPGTGRAKVLARLADAAEMRGLDTEIYHCALEPEEIELLVVPALEAAFLKYSEEIGFDASGLEGVNVTVLDLYQYIDRRALDPFIPAMMEAQQRFRTSLNRAIRNIADAKLTHDYLESFYVPAMDFEAIGRKREETLQRILKWAEEIQVGKLPRVSAG